jgi:hypothetical protein
MWVGLKHDLFFSDETLINVGTTEPAVHCAHIPQPVVSVVPPHAVEHKTCGGFISHGGTPIASSSKTMKRP